VLRKIARLAALHKGLATRRQLRADWRLVTDLLNGERGLSHDNLCAISEFSRLLSGDCVIAANGDTVDRAELTSR
jgi:hypothetical protein